MTWKATGKTRAMRKKLGKLRAKKLKQHGFRKMSSAQKRAFKKMIKAAHKSKAIKRRVKSFKMSVRKGGLAASHMPEVINAIVEMTLEAKDAALGTALLRLDPSLTSTDLGNYALEVVSKVYETKLGAPFLDVELSEDTNKIVLYFEKANEDISDDIKDALSEFGAVEVIAKPGDDMGDDEVSDMYIVGVIPEDTQIENRLAGLFTQEEEDALKEEVEELIATGPG